MRTKEHNIKEVRYLEIVFYPDKDDTLHVIPSNSPKLLPL
ncbi:hypothetical protein NHE_0743 [Neorickettsia helminthoeca str. Oregon]|uniref:Uncharacterized protein n=1 Tax=Neorickettsia helminthoeca str. Oregon TaxID=1286528 RepID=X5HMH7_9RICK|nr:hypothetical protein NHE_0743 [Neorickettsia helminthoeca str. Oregon]